MKTLRTVGITLLIVSGIAILGLGYYGFVPGLSAVLGSAKPRELRVQPVPEDLASVTAKTGMTFGHLEPGLPPEQSIRFSGKKELVADLTDEELTALLRSDDWHYNFIEKGEVRINADGTEEISGLLRLDRIYGYALAHHMELGQVRPWMRALESFTHHPAFYVKLDSSWKDDHLTLRIEKAEIGRYPFEDKYLAKNHDKIVHVIEQYVLSVPELSVRELNFHNGQMHIDGTMPESIEWSQ